jgi:MFS family permease
MKYQHRVIGMLSLLALVTYLDRVCIAVAGPQMQRTLHISPEGWGWVTSVFFISYAAFEIPTGALGDLPLWHPGRGLEHRLVCVVPRFAARDARGYCRRT